MNDQTEKPRVPDTDEPCPPENLPVTCLPDATDEEAARQGCWAYCYGVDRDGNPYSMMTTAGMRWDDGWEQAEIDDCD